MKSFGLPPTRRAFEDARAGVALELWREPSKGATNAFDPMAAVLFLRRNLLRIGAVAALVAALAFGAMLLLFDKYVATAVVMVDPRSAKVVQAGGVLSNIGADAIAIESLVQSTRSEAFTGALVDKLDLVHDDYFAGRGATPPLARQATVEKLAARLNIGRRGTTYVIDVTVASPSAEKSAKIANAAAQMIIDDQRQLRTGASEATAGEIESRLAELRGRVARAEEAAAQLKARLKVTDAGQNATLLERRVFELNQQQVLAGARTAEARARYELLRRAGATAGDRLPPSIQSNVLNALRAEYARLSRQSADQSTILGGRHPEVASLNAQLGDVRRQIDAEISRMLAAARSEFLEAEQREAALSRQLKETQNDSGALGPELVKLGELEREAKAERAVYEQLLTRQRELAETKNLEPSDIRVVSPALPPPRTSPGKTILAAASAALGLLAGLGYALGREMANDALRTSGQAERLSGLDVLALAPLLTAPAGAEGKAAPPELVPWLADLCAAATDDGRDANGRTLLVASAGRGEGRSAIAVNLARAFARGGGRVLLVEADRPAASGVKPRFGLIDVLERGEDLRRALVERPRDGYTVLPFGGRTVARGAPIAALANRVTLRAMFKLLRQWFDIIVIDGPPALESSHARLLAAQADLTAFVVEWDKTSPAHVDGALERLDPGAAALVFNKVDMKRFRLFDPAQSRRLAAQADAFSRAA